MIDEQGDRELDDDLDRVLDRADLEAERDVAEHVPPAFAAVVARARRIDPSAVQAEALARADRSAASARNVRGVGEADTSEHDARIIAPFVAQARDDAELDIAVRERDGVPPMHRASRVRTWTLLGGVMAAAAATILALGLVEGWRATRVAEDAPRTQSLAGADTSPDVHEATRSDAPLTEPASVPRRVAKPEPEAAVEPPVIAPAELPVPEPELFAGAALERSSVPTREGTRAPASKVPKDSLRQLDLRAQAALAAGDRELADRLYAQIIARGQKHPLVELAYGERFSLARPHGAASQRTLWRAYLQSFPQGRFADDAEAGLCRTAAAHDKTRCWSAYVAQFPSGAYRDHADRWVAGADAPTP